MQLILGAGKNGQDVRLGLGRASYSSKIQLHDGLVMTA